MGTACHIFIHHVFLFDVELLRNCFLLGLIYKNQFLCIVWVCWCASELVQEGNCELEVSRGLWLTMYTSYYANKQQAVVGKDANVVPQEKEDEGRPLRPNVPRLFV